MATNPTPNKVLCLAEARTRYQRGKCQHVHIIVDEELAEVECADCGAKLNPIAVLVRYAREESRLSQNIEGLNKARESLDKRLRTKCQHCGQMTRIKGV